MGFVLGIGGTITYPKNNILRDVVKSVGVENIVLETDAPFLPPQNIRGQVNHPKEIVTVANFVGELLGLDLQTISTVTTNNCYKIFGLKQN
jgi:TatD DNase family protein